MRRKHYVLAALLLVLLAWGLDAGLAFAQEAAAPEAVPAAANGEGATHDSYLMWIAKSSGLIGLFLLFLSIYFVALVIRLFLELKPDIAAPPEVIDRAEELLEQRDLKGVYTYLREDDSFFSRVASTGIGELSSGLPEAREAMRGEGEAETVEMEKQISMLAVLGTLGPMIGLLGTLKGMIAAFSVIAMSDVQLKASEVASAISEALLLTFEGVALSVPAIYFFAVFRNRVSHLSVITMLKADHFVRAFAQVAKARSATARPAPNAPAAP